jgi:hypothetical protein
MGYFNFIEQLGDHTPESPALCLDNSTKRIWDRIVTKFSLAELSQPVHTYYHVTDSLVTTRTSRIDRIYTSYSDADDSIVHPRAYIPHLPRTKLHDFDRLLDPSLIKDMGQMRQLSLVASPPTTFPSRSASIHPIGCDVPTNRMLPSG